MLIYIFVYVHILKIFNHANLHVQITLFKMIYFRIAGWLINSVYTLRFPGSSSAEAGNT